VVHGVRERRQAIWHPADARGKESMVDWVSARWKAIRELNEERGKLAAAKNALAAADAT
jgi:hypothetical protein